MKKAEKTHLPTGQPEEQWRNECQSLRIQDNGVTPAIKRDHTFASILTYVHGYQFPFRVLLTFPKQIIETLGKFCFEDISNSFLLNFSL